MDATEFAEFGRPGLAPAILRVGLGLVILGAGLHKFVAPGAWAVYLAPVFTERWPVDLDLTMVVFGVTEVPVALALLADRWTTIAAAIVAVSMFGTLGNLAIAWAQTGQFGDTIVRDFGLLVLATGVTLWSAGPEEPARESAEDDDEETNDEETNDEETNDAETSDEETSDAETSDAE